MTPNELTTLLAEPSGRQFDEPYKLMIFDRAMAWYARLARNTIEKDPRRRKEFLRSLIVDMTKVEKEDCYSLECAYAESKLTLPSSLFINGISFDYVGSRDGSSAFIHTTSPSTLKFFRQNKYQKEVLYYSYLNRKIQVYLNPVIAKVRIDGIFLNLRELHQCDCEGQEEDFWNKDMEIPGDILQLIIGSVEQSLRPQVQSDEIKAAPEG